MMAHAHEVQLKFIWAKKLPSTRYQCSNCGIMVGRFASACHHCGADLR